MSRENCFQLVELKLDQKQKHIWQIGFFGSLIYAIIITVIFFFSGLPEESLRVILYSYMFIAPAILYFVWFMGGYWKLQKIPQNKALLGGNLTIILIFLVMGVFVVTWAAYWNSGIDTFWYLASSLYEDLTKDEVGALVLYEVGSIGVTPALVEEFLKSFPSILAAFVVISRGRNLHHKRKGLLGNELTGMLFGLMVGIAFEILELSLYVFSTFSAGGTLFDVYIQVTVRNWAPIHILGGSIGGYAAGRAERLRFENNEEDFPLSFQIKMFLKRFLPLWFIPVAMHFTWNSSGVWIWLGFYYAQNDDAVLYTIIQFIVLVILAILCFIVLIYFFRKASKVAVKTHRCPETGYYIHEPGVECAPISDILSLPQQQISPIPSEFPPDSVVVEAPKKEFRYCFNCGTKLARTFRFCTNCGADMGYLDHIKGVKNVKPMQGGVNYYYWKPRMYNSFTRIFLILTMIFCILFILGNSFLLWASISILGSDYIPLLLFQFLIELTSSIIFFISAIILKRMEKHYSGKKNIWCWLIFIFNFIGLMFSLILMGCNFVIFDIINTLEKGKSLSILTDIGSAMIFIGGLMLILLVFFFKKGGGQYLLQYQKETTVI
ncbi:MAG: PrsW family glutamic-type intramembrane protease [Promethearchaeota archaeon]